MRKLSLIVLCLSFFAVSACGGNTVYFDPLGYKIPKNLRVMGSIGDNKEYTLIYGGMLTEEKRKHSPEKYFFLPGKTEVISISQTKDVSLYFRLFQSHEFNMIRLKKLITVTPPIKSNLLEEVAPKEKILEEEEFFNSFVKNGAGKWEIPGPLDKALLYHTVKITVLLYERDKAYPLMAIGSVIYKLVP